MSTSILGITAAVALTILIASLVPGPFASVTKAPPQNAPLLLSAQFDPASTVAIRRACQNCHSDETHWPWYSHVAPFSWLIRKDVSQGRQFLNFSQWAAYGTAGQSQLSVLAAQQIKEGKMPPQRYLFLHSEAKLSGHDRSRLVAAFERESARLATSLNQPEKSNH